MLIDLPDETATAALGDDLADALTATDTGLCVTLAGELGSGKTTLVRSVVAALGYPGPVKSPTYTLIEPYEIGGRTLHHLDLYRLGDPVELEYIGFRDIDPQRDWLCIEWAERGAGFLPTIDVRVVLGYVSPGRRAEIIGESARGHAFVARLAAAGR